MIYLPYCFTTSNKELFFFYPEKILKPHDSWVNSDNDQWAFWVQDGLVLYQNMRN